MHAKSEIWEAHHKHILMGAGKYDNKHGVGIVLNKKWRQKTIDTEHISERAITTTIIVNHQRIKLMSLYFHHSGYADRHVEKMYRANEEHTNSSKKRLQIVGGDFNAKLVPGYGVERTSVGSHTLNVGNKRGDWVKHWLMMENKTVYRSPEGTEKQIDYILFKRRHLKYNSDAEANDMIYMDSDHRCVMATFVINTPKRMAPMIQRKTNSEQQSRISEHKRTKKMEKKSHLCSKKDIKSS